MCYISNLILTVKQQASSIVWCKAELNSLQNIFEVSGKLILPTKPLPTLSFFPFYLLQHVHAALEAAFLDSAEKAQLDDVLSWTRRGVASTLLLQGVGPGVAGAGPNNSRDALKYLIAGVAKGTQTAHLSVTGETQRKRAVAWKEFETWYKNTVMLINGNKGPFFATPEIVMAYLEQHWILNHGDTDMGRVIRPAPSSMNGICSCLSAIFQQNGRTGAWQSESQLMQTGNPMESKLLREYKEGYARKMDAAGYAVTSAKHLTSANFNSLVVHYDKLLLDTESTLNWNDAKAVTKYLTMKMDVLSVVFHWETFLRGNNGSRIMLKDFQTAEGTELVPLIMQPGYNIIEGYKYQISLQGSKTKQRNRAGVVSLQAKNDAEGAFCVLRRLQSFLIDCQVGKMSFTKYLFRPINSNQIGFKEHCMDSSCLNRRYQHLLKEIDLFHDETLHGIRRGAMQNAQQQGMSIEMIGNKALQKTREVTEMYLDTSREVDTDLMIAYKRRKTALNSISEQPNEKVPTVF